MWLQEEVENMEKHEHATINVIKIESRRNTRIMHNHYNGCL
jgi:hypothetical protein